MPDCAYSSSLGEICLVVSCLCLRQDFKSKKAEVFRVSAAQLALTPSLRAYLRAVMVVVLEAKGAVSVAHHGAASS